jgi:hypothetical protein
VFAFLNSVAQPQVTKACVIAPALAPADYYFFPANSLGAEKGGIQKEYWSNECNFNSNQVVLGGNVLHRLMRNKVYNYRKAVYCMLTNYSTVHQREIEREREREREGGRVNDTSAETK